MIRNPEYIARICHEANRAYCMTIGDHSQPSWDLAPHWQKQSAIDGVKSALDNKGITAKDSHDGWMALKEKEGWHYGHMKAPEKLEHPCMVSWDELPEEQKIKDELFIAIVNVFTGLEEKAEPVAEPVKVEDPTIETAIITEDGTIAKGAEIEQKIVPKKKKRF